MNIHELKTLNISRLRTGLLWAILFLIVSPIWSAEPAPATTGSKTDLNVLFIGNSMTWFNNMPRTVAELAAQMSPPVQVNIVLSCQACNTTTGHACEGSPTRNAIAYKSNKGGTGNLLGMVDHQNYCFQPALTIAWLEQLLAREPGNKQCKEDLLFLQKRMDSLKSQSDPRWDVVVIQPWREMDVQKVSTNVRTLQDDIAKAAPGAKVILYMDVSDLDRDNSVQTHRSISEEMAVYRQLALNNGVTVAPAALTCLHVNGERPEYWLKDPKITGDVHPGLRGSYAIACSIFTAMFDRSPVGLPVCRMESNFQIDVLTNAKDVNGKPSLIKTYVGGTEHNATLDDRDVRLMQDKAWQAWQEWKDYMRVNH